MFAIHSANCEEEEDAEEHGKQLQGIYKLMKEKKVHFNRETTYLISCMTITTSFPGPRNG